MARGKKKEAALSPAERLQAALVPESEQPYKVPENWCWVRLNLLIQSSKEKLDEFSDVNLKYVGLEHMQKDTGIVAYGSALEVKSLKNVFHSRQILYGKLRPYLNKHDIATFNGVCSTDILVFDTTSLSIPEYINFFFDQNTFIEYVVSNSKGINLPRVSESVILNSKCPLPPLPEQQRIVDRIENLFAKLDEAKQKAQDALDSFETRKAAILHKAFTGELTAQWRKEHGVGMESWAEKTLQDVCSMKITDGTHKTPTYCDRDEGIPFISAKDVTTEKICWDNIKYITPALHKELYTRLAPQIGDVLLAKNGTTGVAAIVDTNKIFDLYVTLAVLRPNTQIIIPRYLLNIVNSPICKNQFDDHLTGIGVPNLHLRDIKAVLIQVPSIEEQAEIVRILDDLLAKEQQAKEAAEKVLEQIDLTKKAILARAFRGELGTNDPNEESAVELLKETLQKTERFCSVYVLDNPSSATYNGCMR